MIILEFLNRHSQLWDPLQPPDSSGETIWDWILDDDLHILNNGSTTRTSHITSNSSIPDISLCGSKCSVKISWKLTEAIGSSDHLPIAIEINHKIHYQPVIPRSARWQRNGVDLPCFTKEVDSKMENFPGKQNLSLHITCFNNILTSAATTYVGKSKPSKKSKPWMTPHMRTKIHIHNCLCRTIHQNWQEWLDASREAAKTINKAKTESWKDFLHNAMLNSDGQICEKSFKV